MGYLICGPVGTGKSFIAECYAGTVGIPCAVLKNFRSKYVGETEGNLEHALDVLRSLGPALTLEIDGEEVGAAGEQHPHDLATVAGVAHLPGDHREDAGRGARIAVRLPVAEVHIPLFYPHDQVEMEAMFHAMARKCHVRLAAGLPGPVNLGLGLSGADIESIALAAKRLGLERAAEAGQPAPAEISADDLRASIEDFMPSAQGLEKEMQEIAAVLECTERRFLPERWREEVAKPGGRARLQERLAAIKAVVGS